MKYYFITYQATPRLHSSSNPAIWNDVISISPMEYILKLQEIEENGGNNWMNFRILFAMEISEEEYLKFEPHFG